MEFAWFCTASLVVVTVVDAVIFPTDPELYKIVSLNDHCDSKDHKQSLNDTSAPQSAGILTAKQLRDLRAIGENGCSFEFSAPGSSGLIVSVVEMNLRMGVLNQSCIDYISVITKFNFGSDKDERCGSISREDNYHFTTTHSLQLKLFSKTPLTEFFDDHILAMVATSYTEQQDGSCGPDEFQCASGGRCIYKGYRCDNVNNCGDNSDEAKMGNSMCLMPLSSLILIVLGLTDLCVTWFIVLFCCIRSALTKQKLREPSAHSWQPSPLANSFMRTWFKDVYQVVENNLKRIETGLQDERWGAPAAASGVSSPEAADESGSEPDEDDQDKGAGDGEESSSQKSQSEKPFQNPLANSIRTKEQAPAAS